jgi:hypothetical protein
MNSIYKRALEVVAWVGEETEDSNLAFDAFEALPKDDSTHWNPPVHPMLQNVLSEPKDAMAIRMFLRRSWLYRVWTVQESVLAQALYFVCGHRRISADKLQAVCKSYSIHLTSCCLGNLREFTWETNDAFSSLDRLNDARAIADTGGRIEELLADFRYRHCTNPRDKVYGLFRYCEEPGYRAHSAQLFNPNIRSLRTSCFKAHLTYRDTEAL